jgi:RNAse (barnase) inhibitor barstar
MQASAVFTTALHGEERELLVELLEAECRRLPVEIHHSHHGEFKNHLRRRLALAEALLERFKQLETS